MIKLLHTSDWHLGKIIYGRSLLDDQRRFIFDFFLPLVAEEKPDAVIIAGDIYDKKIAPPDAIRLFDDALTALCLDCKTRVFIISGNHDSGDRMAIGGALLSKIGLHISLRLQPPEPVTVEKDGKMADIWPIPYFEPIDMREMLCSENIKSFEDGYREYINLIEKKMDRRRVNIAVAHCFVKGSCVCESESPSYIGGAGEIPRELFSAFDYTALGHLHSPQGADNVFYSGSPLKYSFDEQHQTKAILAIEIDDEVSIRRIEVKQPHDMRVLSGKFNDLLELLKKCEDKSDYLFVSLTDEAPVFEPMARLREYYPNLLHIDNRWINTKSAAGDDDFRLRMRQSRVSDETVFSEFLRQICSVEPTEEDLELFAELLKDSGEADRI